MRFALLLAAAAMSFAQTPPAADPWPYSALLQPKQLADLLVKPGPSPARVLFVGFPNLYAGAHLPGALSAGPAANPPGLHALAQAVAGVPHNRSLVIYCGCCPFNKCPNVRPAYRLLHQLGFADVRVLELATNLHTDWVVKGYPVERGPAVNIQAERVSDRPLLGPQNAWTALSLFNPAAVHTKSKTVLLFRAQDTKHTSRIGYADSPDGRRFRVRPLPVLSPEAPYEKNGGVEDPRLVLIDGTYYLTYTGYDTHSAQLCLATSKDLIHWQRRGVLLPAYKGAWNTQWTKSGAIVPEKINGKWWMYYLGTRTDPDGKSRDYMGLAQSGDLLHWQDATNEPVLPRRANAFDSRVMEPGPAPFLLDAGILLLYNGADEKLVYGPGWVLFDRHDPTRLLARAPQPFVTPTLPWEKTGTVPNVIFLEGAIEKSRPQPNELRLTGYYGAADKYIGALDISVSIK